MTKTKKREAYRVVIYGKSMPQFRFLGKGVSYTRKNDRIVRMENFDDFFLAVKGFEKALKGILGKSEIEKETSLLYVKYHEYYPVEPF